MHKFDAALAAIDAAANLAADDAGYVAILESIIDECEARIESVRDLGPVENHATH